MFTRAVPLVCGAMLLSGCLSLSSDDNDDPLSNQDIKLSGVVAAGAPLAGFIASKDAGGNTTTAAIDEDGNYMADISSLTPPFVLYASGLAGGRAYNIASAATVEDADGTVNIIHTRQTPISYY